MRLVLRVAVTFLALPVAGLAQEVPGAEHPSVVGPTARQDGVPPGPSWPRGALIGGLAGGGVGLVLGFVVCSQKTVDDPAVDPTGREERPSDCVIAVALAGLVVGALVGHAIERDTGRKGPPVVLLVSQRDGRISFGSSIAF